MTQTLTPLLLSLLLIVASAYSQANDEQQVMAFFESHSFKPILHIHYNHHFKQSPQFLDFEGVLNEFYSATQDYYEVLYTDCDQDKELTLYACEAMSKTKDNRYITATAPSSEFKSLGKKVIQSPPSTRVLEQTKDVYTVQVLSQFMEKMIPNFYKTLNGKEEYDDFLLPHYSPKLILFIREDEEIPVVLKQLAVAFYLRFDFGIVTDLNEELIELLQGKKYPRIMVIKYNFEEKKHEFHKYEHFDFGEDSYYDVKEFFDQFALSEPRNDLLFHKIFMEPKAEINIAETEGQLEELKERVHGWSIVGRDPINIPERLFDLKKKYDRYFNYIYYKSDVEENRHPFEIYNPTIKSSYRFADEVEFNSLNADDFKSNMTVWLHKDFVVVGVKQEYSHLCGIIEKPLFTDLCRCLIISDDESALLEKAMGIDFEIGFLTRLEVNQKTKEKESKGLKLTSAEYSNVYHELEFFTRTKMKEILDEFLNNPIRQVQEEDVAFKKACFHPTKKCFLLFTNLAKKDRTLQAYTKEVAINYINSFFFYEVDIESNQELANHFGIKGLKADLVVYNPRTEDYTRLNKKVTKSLIDKFLLANMKNDKRLKKVNLDDIDALSIHRRDDSSSDVSSQQL